MLACKTSKRLGIQQYLSSNMMKIPKEKILVNPNNWFAKTLRIKTTVDKENIHEETATKRTDEI